MKVHESVSKPIFRWAGSKRRIIPKIAKLIPSQFNRYVEPFAGSAALFFHLSPARAILGDLNSELIFSYRKIAQNPKRIWEQTSLLPKSEDVYYAIREAQPLDLLSDERAMRFLYLNRYCFNGLYRTNKQGGFNVPYGRDTGQLLPWNEFQISAQQLRSAKLICGDFHETLSETRKGDFVYLDPPYADSSRNGRNEYGEGSFQPADIPRLITSLEVLHSKGVRFLLSYSSSPDFIAALKIHAPRRIRVPRMIAADPALRRNAYEILVTNDDIF